jgi:hypothetical protein
MYIRLYAESSKILSLSLPAFAFSLSFWISFVCLFVSALAFCLCLLTSLAPPGILTGFGSSLVHLDLLLLVRSAK